MVEDQERDEKVCKIFRAGGSKQTEYCNQMKFTDCCSLVASLSQCLCPEYLPWRMVLHCRQDFSELGKGNSQAVRMGTGLGRWGVSSGNPAN